MKRFIAGLLALLPAALGHCQFQYTINEHQDSVSHRYEIFIEDQLVDVVEKTSSAMRTRYILSNSWGPYAVATCRLVSWGSVCNSWKVIDVCDLEGNRIGTIQGISSGKMSATFEFFDENGDYFALAEIDLRKGIVRVHPSSPFDPEQLRYYAVKDSEGELSWMCDQLNKWFSRPMNRIFGAFISDYFRPVRAFTG